MVADDVDDVRALLVDALRASGRFEVVGEAANGRAALEVIAGARPDLALLDLGMPVAGGLDVLDDVRRASPRTRVVVVSGFPREGLAEHVAARGAAGYVRKGLSVKAMIADVIDAAGALDVAEEVLAASSTTLEAGPGTSRQARRFVSDTLGRWESGDVLDTIHLLLSELVTNAVVHARSAPDVAVMLLPDAIRVEVGDNDPTPPTVRQSGEWETSGRGLAILDAYASRWGTRPRPGGKVVWFELSRVP